MGCLQYYLVSDKWFVGAYLQLTDYLEESFTGYTADLEQNAEARKKSYLSSVKQFWQTLPEVSSYLDIGPLLANHCVFI